MRNAIEIAADIRNAAEWDNDLCAELCKAAGMENGGTPRTARLLNPSSMPQPKNWA